MSKPNKPSKVKVSKEGKSFRDFYEIGSVHIPNIIAILKKIRDLRIEYHITRNELQEYFEHEKYFISTNNYSFDTSEYNIGKGNTMYLCWNSDISILSQGIYPENAIVQSFTNKCNYVQFTPNKTKVFGSVNYITENIELPKGLDVMNLPDESMFQTELYVQSTLLDGAAVLMGIQASGIQDEILYYGDSLLKMKRLADSTEVVYNKLCEKYVILKA